jgi:hypothetical protein
VLEQMFSHQQLKRTAALTEEDLWQNRQVPAFPQSARLRLPACFRPSVYGSSGATHWLGGAVFMLLLALGLRYNEPGQQKCASPEQGNRGGRAKAKRGRCRDRIGVMCFRSPL